MMSRHMVPMLVSTCYCNQVNKINDVYLFLHNKEQARATAEERDKPDTMMESEQMQTPEKEENCDTLMEWEQMQT